MKKRFTMLFVGLLALTITGFTQSTIVLAEGDDLITVVAGAAAGDTIAIEPGFHVAQYANILVEKSLAFISTDKNVKPNVYIKQFDIQGTDLNLFFKGINFSSATVDSLAQTEDTTVLFSADSYFLNLTTTHVSINKLTIQNCVIRNIGRAVIRADRAANTATTIIIDDCIMYDQRGAGDYGVFRTKSNIDIGTFNITNSTFYAITNRFIDLETAPGSPVVNITNCTFHRWGGGKSAQYLFDIKLNETATLKIQSCILGKTNDNELVLVNGWRMVESANLEMTNSVMSHDFILTDGTYALALWDKTEYNLEETDPEFADPDNGDFTLPETSDLLMWSPEGTVIGDPRWSPLSNSTTQLFHQEGVKIYPNPASQYFTIATDQEVNIELYNITGKRIRQFDKVSKNSMLDISDLNPGIYFIRMNNENANAGKLVIN